MDKHYGEQGCVFRYRMSDQLAKNDGVFENRMLKARYTPYWGLNEDVTVCGDE